MNFKFNVDYFKVNEADRCPTVSIETTTIKEKNSFSYGNFFGMYKTDSTQGHGIQVNDEKLEKPLLKMCDKIAQAVYDFQKEIK